MPTRHEVAILKSFFSNFDRIRTVHTFESRLQAAAAAVTRTERRIIEATPAEKPPLQWLLRDQKHKLQVLQARDVRLYEAFRAWRRAGDDVSTKDVIEFLIACEKPAGTLDNDDDADDAVDEDAGSLVNQPIRLKVLSGTVAQDSNVTVARLLHIMHKSALCLEYGVTYGFKWGPVWCGRCASLCSSLCQT